MVLIDQKISQERLKEIASWRFGDMVKGVVDVERRVMALGADLHADEEAFLLEKGSKQNDLWGINLYPDLSMPDFLEYDSMINVRPQQNNRSRDVEDEKTRELIKEILFELVEVG
ncbi:hypothetical protein KJ855_01005 [Patescibacteria group bacterium]|nr:hypothetical protein [Patescibacteria group bacterium]